MALEETVEATAYVDPAMSTFMQYGHEGFHPLFNHSMYDDNGVNSDVRNLAVQSYDSMPEDEVPMPSLHSVVELSDFIDFTYNYDRQALTAEEAAADEEMTADKTKEQSRRKSHKAEF
jgi:hypothetical protein